MDWSIKLERWSKRNPAPMGAGNGLPSSCWGQFLFLYVGLIFCCIFIAVNSPSVIWLHEKLFPEPMDFRWWYSLQILATSFALLSSAYALWLMCRRTFVRQSLHNRLVMLAAFLLVPMVVYKSAVVVLLNMGPL